MAEKRLTYKQAAFCREYVNNHGNATEAYLKVYDWNGSYEGAKQQAYVLMREDHIKQEIETLTKPALNKTKSTIEERINVLNGIIDNPDEKTENIIRAIDLLNRMYGVYVNRTENTNNDTIKLDLSAIDKLLE